MNQVLVIGGGPAGIMAAIMAARNNKKVILLEKNDKLGKKLFITGKGRCNITNICDVEGLLESTLTNRKFMYSAYYSFDSHAVIEFFEKIGLKTKVERGNRAFPLSDKSSDVIKVLQNEMERLGVEIFYNMEVKDMILDQGCVTQIITRSRTFDCDKVILATGGLSYALTGSTGDGYRFAKKLGHNVVQLSPGLVPIETKEPWVRKLQGLSLKNVSVQIIGNQKGKTKILYEEFGEMLFTHYGVSGPLILSGSSFLPKDNVHGIKIIIDLKPSLSIEQLDARLLRDFQKYSRKQFCNSLDDLLPQKLIPIIIELSNIDEATRVDQITKEERKNLVQLLKGLTCTIQNKRQYNEAIITRGGVDVKEINPNTMSSKLVDGLYFAGEVLDLDALTGGFNLQIAFSTGYLAGISV
ncbi:MAG: aminoacetone oxidase family FAD-binding enzyme [Firmicutes bacterium HGW-Firmicutes-7]|nr:MAG: aminoacetone oxidase family FAD-binding enzyme [Firmicutes bacterium HGW-Firmicutes-7]